MPFCFEVQDVIPEVVNFKSVLIVPCRFCPAASMAVRNRMVVPLLATYNSFSRAGTTPAQPSSCNWQACRSHITSRPRPTIASIITSVSSHSKTPSSVDRPSDSAAQITARLVMLFDPGGRIVAWIAPHGAIAILLLVMQLSVRGVSHLFILIVISILIVIPVRPQPCQHEASNSFPGPGVTRVAFARRASACSSLLPVRSTVTSCDGLWACG
jgi:hypothetical protein